MELTNIPPWTGPMPEGCKCKAETWYTAPATVCNCWVKARHDAALTTMCGRCEHDKDCHTAWHEGDDDE